MARRPPGFIDKGYFALQADHPDCDSVQSVLTMNEAKDVRTFLNIFSGILHSNMRAFHANIEHPKRFSMNFVRVILRKIIPIELFGSVHNFKKFFKIIVKLCTSSIQENINMKYLLDGWQIDDIIWLANSEHKELVLTSLVLWLVTFVRKHVLRHIYFIQRDTKSFKVNFYCLTKYKSLCDTALHQMIKKGQLIPAKTVTQSESILRICPKANGYRPVVRTKVLQDISARSVGRHLNGHGLTFDRSLYSAWLNCATKVRNQQLYGIKLDLQDAFSNVNIDGLKPFVKRFLNDQPVLQKKVLASLENQSIKYGKKYFYWNRGIMQGMRLSSSLCDLERSFFDAARLRIHITKGTFFHRTVDDYLYCSTDKADVLEVKEILNNNCYLTAEKTETNVNNNNVKISYYGRKFNLDTKEIEILIDSSLTTYRFKSKIYYVTLDDYSEAHILEFLKQISAQKSNAFIFSRELLNLAYNSREVVLDNYFKAMLVVAFKVDCAIKERLVTVPENLLQIINIIVQIIVKSTRNLLVNSKLDRSRVMDMPRRIFKVLGYKAFLLVMKRRAIPYQDTIKALQKQARYKHPLIGNKFEKMPVEFANIRTRRVLPAFK